MKRISFAISFALLALFLAACAPGGLQINCEGIYIAAYTEDVSGSGIPVPLPFHVKMRIIDGAGNELFNENVVTITAAGILSTNGGFHEYSQEPESEPLNIFISATGQPGEVLAGALFSDCVSSPIIYFTDDRIGPDTATSLNAYVRENGLAIFSEYNGTFIVSYDAIHVAGIPSQNTLISSHNGIDVYVLTDGFIQIMESVAADGKRDILIIDLNEDGVVERWRRGTFNTATGITNIHLQSAGWDGYPMNF